MKSIIIDCDTGNDDAVAIIFALANDLNVIGITTVGGNVTVDSCTLNTLKILELIGKNVPVYQGEQQPLSRKLTVLQEGLMGADDDLPAPITSPKPISATDFLRETFKEPSDTSILAIAPMTNIAKSQIRVAEITMMGGCPFPEPTKNRMGNMQNGIAEYNSWADPEAFKAVAANTKMINMIGLNITQSVMYNYRHEEKLRAINTKISNKVADLLSVLCDNDKRDFAHLCSFPNDPVRGMHDVVAAAYMVDRSIFKSELLPIEIGENGETRIIRNGVSSATLMNVITDIDREKFFDLFYSSITRYQP